MRSLVAALVLLTAPAAFAQVLLDPDSPNLGSDLPPLGCRHAFPPHAWCVEQQAAAEAFHGKCHRILGGVRDRKEQERWASLYRKAQTSCTCWWLLARVQDPSNVEHENTRRRLLRLLYEELGPDAFFAGRMPPPIPPDAPVD